jgi:hypothetical protein
MHKQKLFVVIAGAVSFLSAFMAWDKVSVIGLSRSYSGFSNGDGYVLLILGIAAAAIALTQGEKTQELAPKMKKVVAIAGAVATLVMIYDIYLISSTQFHNVGLGAWLGLLGSLGMLAIPFVIKGDGEFEMPSKDSIKADLAESDNLDENSSQNETDQPIVEATKSPESSVSNNSEESSEEE